MMMMRSRANRLGSMCKGLREDRKQQHTQRPKGVLGGGSTHTHKLSRTDKITHTYAPPSNHIIHSESQHVISPLVNGHFDDTLDHEPNAISTFGFDETCFGASPPPPPRLDSLTCHNMGSLVPGKPAWRYKHQDAKGLRAVGRWAPVARGFSRLGRLVSAKCFVENHVLHNHLYVNHCYKMLPVPQPNTPTNHVNRNTPQHAQTKAGTASRPACPPKDISTMPTTTAAAPATSQN
jgi:hypothetical protein